MKIGNLVSRLRIRRPRIRFKVRSRIAVVALLPLFGMTVFAGLFAYDQYQVSRSAERIQDLAERTPQISALIHELQRERGAAAGFLAADGNSSARRPMEAQYPATDTAIAQFGEVFDGFPFAAYSENFRTDIEELKEYLDQIPATRDAVSGLSMMHSGMNEFYTNAIGAAFDTIAAMSLISTNAELSGTITAYEALLDAKEKMGLERATGAAGFALGRFSPSAHQEFIRLGAAADNELAAFEALASQELMDLLFEFKVSPQALDVQRMRSAAIDSGYGREISDASLEEWFAASTAKIEMVREIEQTVGGQLVDIAHAINTKASANLYIAVAITVAFLVVNLFIAFLIARGVTRPLQRLNATMREIAEGDIECTVPDQGKHDEIGEMARSVEFFRSKLVENKELEAKQQRDAVRAEEEKRASMLKLAQEFEDSVGKLISGVGAATEQMKSSATAMTSIADEASQRSATVAAASEEASANVQTVATAAEEMSSSVQEISRQVSQSAQMAGNAVSQATETNDKVMGLADAAQKIGEVVEMISDIAAQTNLLALNATIEASRAGEAGKGFAVVATEVKSLATQTAKATEEIAAQIGAIQDETRSAVDAIQTITKAIGEISDVATAIASAVEEQGAATDEIATNVQQAASGTQDVSSNISEVSRGAQEAGSAAQQVLDAAGQLGQQTSELQSAVDTFLDTVRAA